jgi:hypothetical protein
MAQGTVLTRGHREWATTPDDDRYESVAAARDAAHAFEERTRQPVVPVAGLHLDVDQDDVVLTGKNGRTGFTHHSFGQFASQMGVGPAAPVLRQMPADLVKRNLEWGMAQHRDGQIQAYLVPPNGERGTLIASTGPGYGRVKNGPVLDAILAMNERAGGIWGIPPGTGDPTRDSTVYLSDLGKLFVFLCDEGRGGFEVGGEVLKRGFWVWNSTLGDRSWGMTAFTYGDICGNRYVWDAGNIQEFRFVHRAGAASQFAEIAGPALDSFATADIGDVVKTIEAAKTTFLGKNVEETRAALLAGKWSSHVVDVTLDRAAEGGAYGGSGDPTVLWNVVAAATSYARDLRRQDDRLDLERTAGALLQRVAVA